MATKGVLFVRIFLEIRIRRLKAVFKINRHWWHDHNARRRHESTGTQEDGWVNVHI